MSNMNLRSARNIRNDEFYTRLSDISNELVHYRQHFKDKIVFCNCDNPVFSAFWQYFHLNFSALGLKKLVATYYDVDANTFKMEYDGGNDADIAVCVRTDLMCNGDFRSSECLELLDLCDIVVTNPPFSLFREYVSVLIEHNKDFLIVGNKNAVSCKGIFPLVRDNKMWFGVNRIKEFDTPYGDVKKFGNVGWYTNLDVDKRRKNLVLQKCYTSEEYPFYDNYDAINVNKLVDIPCDYYGVMGVPLTFFDFYNPEQFEIVTLGSSPDLFTATKKYTDLLRYNLDGTTTKEHIACNQCLTIGYDEKPDCVYYTASNSDKYLVIPYVRVLIRRR